MEQYVLTLVAAAPGGLADRTARSVRDALRDLGADAGPPRWLAEDTACDLEFAMLAPEQAEAAARHRLKEAAVDCIAQGAGDRRKRLLVADMDATIAAGESLDDLARLAGLGEAVAAITDKSVNGRMAFNEALRRRVGLLEGLPAELLERACEAIRLTPGARTLVRTMRAGGACTVLVSGSFRQFVSRVAQSCGFDLHEANDAEIADGRLTGRLCGPVLDQHGKLAALIRIAAERQIPLRLAVAVGDGANDIEMIKAAGLGVAFRPKAVVAAQARSRIMHGDLTALLYAQGYRREDFVE